MINQAAVYWLNKERDAESIAPVVAESPRNWGARNRAGAVGVGNEGLAAKNGTVAAVSGADALQKRDLCWGNKLVGG